MTAFQPKSFPSPTRPHLRPEHSIICQPVRDPRPFRQRYDFLCDLSLLGPAVLHNLRHSFASFLVNSGRSLYEVQKLLGHFNAKTTQRYAHLAPGALIEAANIVGNLVQAKTRVAAE